MEIQANLLTKLNRQMASMAAGPLGVSNWSECPEWLGWWLVVGVKSSIKRKYFSNSHEHDYWVLC